MTTFCNFPCHIEYCDRPTTKPKVRRSADPDPQNTGGAGRFYTKGQLGENVRWSNDQHLIDMGRTPNNPGWIVASLSQKVNVR